MDRRGLLSLSVFVSLLFDFPDRHVVVYKAGHESDDPSAGPLVIANSSLGTRKPKAKSAEFIPLPVGALTKVNQVKRDRRTMEEVQSVSRSLVEPSLITRRRSRRGKLPQMARVRREMDD
jgi:hypothetical protein